MRSNGPRWSAEVFNQLPTLIPRLEHLKRTINELRDLPIFSDIDDEVIEVSRAYGDHDSAEDFLDAFDQLVSRSQNEQAAIDAIINRPRDLTRSALLQLQEWFDKENYNDSTLRAAWKAAKNQDIAARLVGHIRRAAIGDPLQPFEERVDKALARIKGQHDWDSEQLTWLERLADSIKEKVVLDDDTFKVGNYRRRGGKPKLMQLFDDKLDELLAEFSQLIWDKPA